MNQEFGIKNKDRQSGFTLMEIMVSTVIFAIVAVALLSLFNFVLKINRKSEALRQTSQGMRDMVEYIVKEVRNGQIDYGFVDPGGTTASSPPCPGTSLSSAGYSSTENRLALLNTDNVEECLYYGNSSGSYIGANIFSSSTGGSTLVLAKTGLTAQVLNPANFTIDQLMFLVRPLNDPYSPGNTKFQPMVTIIIQATTKLPTGEKTTIYYQTSISTSKYDIPNFP
jgi:prepilin-type N-terminal cleavage/methylation domain-containing protein